MTGMLLAASVIHYTLSHTNLGPLSVSTVSEILVVLLCPILGNILLRKAILVLSFSDMVGTTYHTAIILIRQDTGNMAAGSRCSAFQRLILILGLIW